MSSSWILDFGIPILLTVSTIFQVILGVFGRFRKGCSKKWFILLLWISYQLADVVAITGLGMMINHTQPPPADELNHQEYYYFVKASWSSTILWHLGGPDSITAFSLDDNELWFRHSLQFIYRVVVAGYIHVRLLHFITQGLDIRILMVGILAAGIFKYGEKIWALRLANMASLRASILPPPIVGPRPLIIDDDDDNDDDVHIDAVDAPSNPVPVPLDEDASRMAAALAPIEESLLELDSNNKEILLRGHYHFCNFKCLFVDLMVPYSHIIDSQRFFLRYPCDVAFQLIDLELSFMYDMLFTKVPVVHTYPAYALRLFRLSVLIMNLILDFLTLQSINTSEFLFYILSDAINWILVQELFEIIQILLSEWTVVWMNKYRLLKRLSTIILSLILFSRSIVSKIISCCNCGVKAIPYYTTTIWWHNNTMAQYNLLSFCFEDNPTMFKRNPHLSSCIKSFHEWVETSRNTTYIHVPDNMKDFIYQQFKDMVQSFDEETRSAGFGKPRGEWVMERNNFREHNCLEELGWSVVDVEFDRSILIWHVTTEFCYYYDDLGSDNCEAETLLQVQVSKALSNYLLYLLLILPSMLSNTIGKISFEDTCVTIKKVFNVPKDKRQKKSKPFSFILQRKKLSLDEKQKKTSIMRLLRSDAQVLIKETKSGQSNSVLLEAHKLAKLLQCYEKEERWKIISGVWVEMLSYAARNCSGKHHAQQLSYGGEFLTKIWLLMAHLGMVYNYIIYERSTNDNIQEGL